MFSIKEVQSEDFELFEQLGTKTKFWYDKSAHLFKAGREGTGENWAEVVCARIAEELGLPHAEYELAVTPQLREDGQITRGVSTPNFTPVGSRLVLGNELIVSVSRDEKSKAHDRRRQHTVSRLHALLSLPIVGTPIGWVPPPGVRSAAGVMAGYLLLDALVGNQDRHEENWGLIITPPGVRLAPTFDHASSLGRNETDARRLEKLRHVNPAHGVAGFSARALSQLHNKDGKRLTTDQAFTDFAASCHQDEVAHWMNRVRSLEEGFFRDLLREVPDDWISDPAREFAVRMLVENRKRLLQVAL